VKSVQKIYQKQFAKIVTKFYAVNALNNAKNA
jgi:hypothetical protein